ncbi:M56 family metallopeptidase [Actinomadura parmotrematis]|uniref:M56 family metallopeptidase n=1 Tax=Actinomadura parmotrematis TaxID=2864039 RepID=A0ABS7G4U0_9ACTN|nr:M56 family metallopeptidase [Actinomadura parmotrematis]MBW8487481.1 M56 family metallopeptidase [Actinomadura parmotrematis]
MFDHFVWSVLVVPVLLVGTAALPARRLAPATGAAALAWSAFATALAAVAVLAAFTVAAAAEVPAVAARFGESSRTVADDTAHVPWVTWLSAALLAAGLVAAARVRRRHRRGRSVARRFAGLPADRAIVLVDDEAVDAFAVPGRPGRIVVTTAMRAALDDRQFEALVAHERAHLDAGHPRLILLAELAGALHPALRWVAPRVSYLIERAADEQAARAVGDRRTVAKAIGAAALAAAGRPAPPAPSAVSFARAVRPGAVPRRVGELLAPPPAGRLAWLAAVPALLAASSIVWTGEALIDLVELLAKAHGTGP